MSFDIKSLVTVKEKAESEGVWVNWDDELSFLVNYIGKGIIKEARKKSLVKTANRRTHQIEESIDDDKFDKELMELSFSSWKGMKVKHLKELLDPSITEIVASPDKDELAVEFSEENKGMLTSYYNLSFSRFITSVATEIEVYQKYKEEELLKN